MTDSFTPRALSTTRRTIRKSDEAYLVVMKAHGQEAEECVGAGDEGDRDGEHIVDQEGAARDDARPLADRMGGHDVAAASVGEMLDDPRVGVRDDKDGERRGEGKKDGEVGVGPEGPERLFGAVGRGREAVRPEADPGQDGDEAQLVEERGIAYISGAPMTARRALFRSVS